MGRSGYDDDCDTWGLIRYRGAVASAIRGKRGQELLRDLASALDAMPDKQLFPGNFATAEGEFCALGVLGVQRGTKMDDLGNEDGCNPDLVAKRFDIASAMAREIMYINDECAGDDFEWQKLELCGPMRPNSRDERMVWAKVPSDKHAEKRWEIMRKWVDEQLNKNRGVANELEAD